MSYVNVTISFSSFNYKKTREDFKKHLTRLKIIFIQIHAMSETELNYSLKQRTNEREKEWGRHSGRICHNGLTITVIIAERKRKKKTKI